MKKKIATFSIIIVVISIIIASCLSINGYDKKYSADDYCAEHNLIISEDLRSISYEQKCDDCLEMKVQNADTSNNSDLKSIKGEDNNSIIQIEDSNDIINYVNDLSQEEQDLIYSFLQVSDIEIVVVNENCEELSIFGNRDTIQVEIKLTNLEGYTDVSKTYSLSDEVKEKNLIQIGEKEGLELILNNGEKRYFAFLNEGKCIVSAKIN